MQHQDYRIFFYLIGSDLQIRRKTAEAYKVKAKSWSLNSREGMGQQISCREKHGQNKQLRVPIDCRIDCRIDCQIDCHAK